MYRTMRMHELIPEGCSGNVEVRHVEVTQQDLDIQRIRDLLNGTNEWPDAQKPGTVTRPSSS